MKNPKKPNSIYDDDWEPNPPDGCCNENALLLIFVITLLLILARECRSEMVYPVY